MDDTEDQKSWNGCLYPILWKPETVRQEKTVLQFSGFFEYLDTAACFRAE